MQQTTSFTNKGIQISRIALAFSMFPMAINSSKYTWVMILPGLAMLYFSFRKYKEEKNAGLEHSKYGLITIVLSVSMLAIIFASISNYLIGIGYYD